LQQRESKFPVGGGRLLSLWRQRRHPAVGWIDNQRRSRPGAPPGDAYRVVGAGDIGLASVFRTNIRERSAALFVQFGSLCLGEKFLSRIFGGALQGRIKFVSPNSLQIGFAPGGLPLSAPRQKPLKSV
jgi:hypothetical protein